METSLPRSLNGILGKLTVQVSKETLANENVLYYDVIAKLGECSYTYADAERAKKQQSDERLGACDFHR